MRKYLVFLFIPVFLSIWANSRITAHKNPSDTTNLNLKSELNEGVENITLDKENVYTECPWNTYNYQKEEAVIKVTTTVKNNEKNNITYYYIVSGGKIVGTGANVSWDLSKERPGKYTITVGVGNDYVIKGNFVTKTIKLEEQPYCHVPPPPCYCPTISISAPSKPVKSGDSIIFAADVTGIPQSIKISYEWSLSGGQIVGSKSALQVLVNTFNIQSNSITATIKIDGPDPGCGCALEMSKTVYISREK